MRSFLETSNKESRAAEVRRITAACPAAIQKAVLEFVELCAGAAEERGREAGIKGKDSHPDLMPDKEAWEHAKRVRAEVLAEPDEAKSTQIMRGELIMAHSAGYFLNEDHACPCLYGDPCSDNCTCVQSFSSRGCGRCCSYGSYEQRAAMAKHLIAQLAAGATA